LKEIKCHQISKSYLRTSISTKLMKYLLYIQQVKPQLVELLKQIELGDIQALFSYVRIVLQYARLHQDIPREELYEELFALQLKLESNEFTDMSDLEGKYDAINEFFMELQTGKTPTELLELLDTIHPEQK
jgi:hypothetical protein